MKNILITAATSFEYDLLQKQYTAANVLQNKEINLTFLTTGIGIMATSVVLCGHFNNNKYDFAINIGIAGAYLPLISLTDVVQVSSDTLAWLGVEDNADFIPASELALPGVVPVSETFKPYMPFYSKKIKTATALTVHTATGSTATVLKNAEKYPMTEIETMEGASFYNACNMYNQPCMQLRAISNRVEPRNRANWKIPEALNNLTETTVQYIDELCL